MLEAKDVKGVTAETRKRMEAAVEHVRRELSAVRTGRASTALLDTVNVEAYGTMMPVNHGATLATTVRWASGLMSPPQVQEASIA